MPISRLRIIAMMFISVGINDKIYIMTCHVANMFQM